MECHDCSDEIDEPVIVKEGRKKLKLCEDCAEIRRENQEIEGGALSAMQDMMEYKGR